MKTNIQYSAPDHYLVDDLFTDEHKIVRGAIRDWVNREVKPVIEEYYEKAEFPRYLIKQMGEMGVFGPFIPLNMVGPEWIISHTDLSCRNLKEAIRACVQWHRCKPPL